MRTYIDTQKSSSFDRTAIPRHPLDHSTSYLRFPKEEDEDSDSEEYNSDVDDNDWNGDPEEDEDKPLNLANIEYEEDNYLEED